MNNIQDEKLKTVRSFADSEYPLETNYLKMSMLSMNLVRWHWHEELEILLVDTGEICLKTEDREIILRAGQGVFLNRNLLHSIRMSGDTDSAFYSMDFHPALLFGYGTNLLSAKYLAPVLSSPDFKYLLLDNGADTADMLNIVWKLVRADISKDLGYELEVKSYLGLFWARLLKYAFSSAPVTSRTAASGYDASRIKTAIRFIENHYAEPLSLERIADSIHISKSECCRCFRRTLGLTPFEYLMKYRIFESARKMQNKEAAAETISDLAASVGFNSPSYYNKIFKKYLNCTPLEYKRKIALNSLPLTQNSFLPLGGSVRPGTNSQTG